MFKERKKLDQFHDFCQRVIQFEAGGYADYVHPLAAIDHDTTLSHQEQLDDQRTEYEELRTANVAMINDQLQKLAEKDATIRDLETKLEAAETKLEARDTTIESLLESHETKLTANASDLEKNESRIKDLESQLATRKEKAKKTEKSNTTWFIFSLCIAFAGFGICFLQILYYSLKQYARHVKPAEDIENGRRRKPKRKPRLQKKYDARYVKPAEDIENGRRREPKQKPRLQKNQNYPRAK